LDPDPVARAEPNAPGGRVLQRARARDPMLIEWRDGEPEPANCFFCSLPVERGGQRASALCSHDPACGRCR
jgi:hypothetical protein